MACADGVGTITLDRPARLNAYTPEMGEDLVEAFEALWADPGVAAIVMTGEGRGFCAGADRQATAGAVGESGLRLGEERFLTGFAERLAASEKPLVAAVGGAAVGLGATMTLTFDARLASPAASFAFPFARLGIMPGMGSTWLLPRLVGPSRARRILLAGETLDAAAACACGLVDEVAPAEALAARAFEMARALACGGREVTAAIRGALAAAERGSIVQAVEREILDVGRLARLREARR
ncbi:MAG: enoyl-CoA hydratase/isomerase family protein [Caulobacteraceae bacterium]|nr:enoyl-CoA hydratase/isomerase family protein [Caulobacteraceae bacterium]